MKLIEHIRRAGRRLAITPRKQGRHTAAYIATAKPKRPEARQATPKHSPQRAASAATGFRGAARPSPAGEFRASAVLREVRREAPPETPEQFRRRSTAPERFRVLAPPASRVPFQLGVTRVAVPAPRVPRQATPAARVPRQARPVAPVRVGAVKTARGARLIVISHGSVMERVLTAAHQTPAPLHRQVPQATVAQAVATYAPVNASVTDVLLRRLLAGLIAL